MDSDYYRRVAEQRLEDDPFEINDRVSYVALSGVGDFGTVVDVCLPFLEVLFDGRRDTGLLHALSVDARRCERL